MKKKLSVLLIPVIIVALVGAIAFTGCKQIPESASQVETTAAETMAEETMAEETTAAAEETAAGGEMGIFLQAPGEIFKAKELAPPISEFKETYAAIDTYEHALTPEGEKVKIGFILPDMRVERFTRDKEIFTRYAESFGAEVIVDSSNYDHALQTTQVENMLAQGVDVLVIHPVNGDIAGVFVDMAHKVGVPVIASDGVIKHPDLDLFITQDSITVGQEQAKAYIEMVGEEGKYVVIMGQPGHSVAKLITQGNHDILDQYPGTTSILETFHEGWAAELAQKTAEDVLTRESDDIQAFFCNNSGMANGVLQAVIERDLAGNIFVAGSDADITMCKNILAYENVIDVIKWIAPLSAAAAEAAIALATGQYEMIKYHQIYDFEDPNGSVQQIVTPVTMVNKENIMQTVVDTNWISASDLGL